MIISRGAGGLAVLILGAGGGGGTGIGIAFGGAGSGGNWGTVIGFLLAALLLWRIGRALNKPVAHHDPATGETITVRNTHTMFWIPLQYYGVFALGVSVWVTVLVLSRP